MLNGKVTCPWELILAPGEGPLLVSVEIMLTAHRLSEQSRRDTTILFSCQQKAVLSNENRLPWNVYFLAQFVSFSSAEVL